MVTRQQLQSLFKISGKPSKCMCSSSDFHPTLSLASLLHPPNVAWRSKCLQTGSKVAVPNAAFKLSILMFPVSHFTSPLLDDAARGSSSSSWRHLDQRALKYGLERWWQGSGPSLLPPANMNTTGMSLADELKLLSQVSADQQTARVSRATVLSLRR